ncbi:hypothetical protein [Kutzneria albida]|uniref:hypothetical protein n=1 Tax=Kutzneria albida TaxID=43357 RepID=UPI0011DCE062|nr:hypothetical protein [Kutzneria albida]
MATSIPARTPPAAHTTINKIPRSKYGTLCRRPLPLKRDGALLVLSRPRHGLVDVRSFVVESAPLETEVILTTDLLLA